MGSSMRTVGDDDEEQDDLVTEALKERELLKKRITKIGQLGKGG